MPITHVDLLNCAVSVAECARGDEAHIRAAVSRAYYAAFHDCQNWYDALPARGHLPSGSGGGVHVDFATRLLNPDKSLSSGQAAASKKRGMALKALHGDRVIADYRLAKTVSAYDARNALSAAKRIIGTV